MGGLTIHRLFQLPVEHDAKTATYWTLSKDARKVMKTTLRSVKLFIVDEVSMVSSLNLVYVHMRLDELFGGDKLVRRQERFVLWRPTPIRARQR